MPPVLFVLLAVLVLTVVSGVYVFLVACLGRKDINWLDEEQARKTPWGQYYQQILDSHNWLKDNLARDVYIKSFDGLELHGLWIPAQRPKGTVIMAHGYRSTMLVDCHLGFELFHRLGYNILVPEQRTHGQSGGRFITFGVKESRDMAGWVRFHNATLFTGKVILFGISMGASTMLYLADKPLPENVRGIIADCGFTSPGAIIASVYRRVIGLPAGPTLWVAGFLAKLFAGFGFWESDTRKSLKNSRLPILLIHGTEDAFVPAYMSQQAYDACISRKKLFLAKGADHGLSFLADGYGYTAAVMDFLNTI